MKTRSGRELFKNFRILLEIGSSPTIVMGKLTPKPKKIRQKLRGKPKQGSSRPQIK